MINNNEMSLLYIIFNEIDLIFIMWILCTLHTSKYEPKAVDSSWYTICVVDRLRIHVFYFDNLFFFFNKLQKVEEDVIAYTPY